MRSLSLGARAPEVLALQRLLNKHGASPALTEDEAFGPRTQAAIVAFKQRKRMLPADGSVTPALWTQLGLRLDVVHGVSLFGQPTGMTCWSAAATMMGGNVESVGAGGASTSGVGGLQMPLENIETFVASRHWRMINNQSRPAITVITGALTRGPVWLAFEGGTFQHAVVASGVWGDGTDDGTVFRIHDPWPPGRGTVYATGYVNGQVALRSISPPRRAMIQYAAAA